jgi:hypothetical protein
MFKRAFVALLIVVMLFSVGTVLAQDLDKDVDHGYHIIRLENEQPFAIFMDGRLNATDIGAPIVVFYKTQPTPVMNPDGTQAWANGRQVWEDQVAAFEVLSVRPEGNVDLALSATVEQIKAAVASAVPGQNQTIVQNGPVSLNYSPTGWFWVQGQYADGKPYTFQWQAPDF